MLNLFTLGGDLETIVGKALEKDKDRRSRSRRSRLPCEEPHIHTAGDHIRAH